MSEIADRYRTACQGFTDVIEDVPADAWSNQSPCEEWTAKDVAAHLVDATRGFYERNGAPLPPAPSAQEDPVGAWTATRDAAIAALEDPAVAGQVHDGGMGPMSLEATIDRFMVGDTVIHTWDLATAVGKDVQLDEGLLGPYLEGLQAMGDRIRQNNVFGPEITPPPGADLQTRTLAFVGRKAF